MINPLEQVFKQSGINPALAKQSSFYRPPPLINLDQQVVQQQPMQTRQESYNQLQQPAQQESPIQQGQLPVGSRSSFNMSTTPQTGRVGGSRSWRNANPGNLKYGDFTRKHGAIGKDANGFAIFPNEHAGRGAMASLLRGGTYGNLPISRAISRYAPSSDNNNVPAYVKATGVNPNATLGSLDDSTFNMLLDNMIKHEGWKPGRTS